MAMKDSRVRRVHRPYRTHSRRWLFVEPRRLWIPAAAAALWLFLLPASQSARAHTQSYSFLWANDASGGAYAPAEFYRHNESGSLATVLETAPAEYRVRFYGLSKVTGTSGNVHVSAYGGEAVACQVTDFSFDDAWVACFDADGLPAPSRFSLLFVKREDHADELAYTRAREPTNPSYSPAGEDTLNPSGGGASVTRVSTGVYEVAFPGVGGIGVNGGNVQVTTAGSSAARCKVEAWGSEIVSVLCQDATGSPADAEFTLLFMKPGASREGLAYAWVDDPYSPTSSPPSFYTYNSGGGAVSVTRLGTGYHRVDFAGMASEGLNGGNAQVTAYGSSDDWCIVDSWGPDQVRVRCYDPTGAAIDTPFSVVLYRTPRAPLTSQYAFALANQPLLSGYDAPESTSWSAANRRIRLTRSSTGIYQAQWPGMDEVGSDEGIVVVSADDSGEGFCKVVSWSSSAGNVRCFDASGSLSDRSYNILYLKPEEGTPGVAYAWASQPTTTSYTPLAAYSHNPTGGGIDIERMGEGVYFVTFEGYGATTTGQGHVQATAYGASADYCVVNNFFDGVVEVYCFDPDGNRKDSQFSLAYLDPDAKRDGLAYATFFGGATPPPDYSYNPEGGDVARTLVSTGLYQVDFDGFDLRGLPAHQGHMQVSSFYSSGARLCKGAGLSASPLAACMEPGGSPANDDFTILFLKPTTVVPEPAVGRSLFVGLVILVALGRAPGGRLRFVDRTGGPRARLG